MTTAEQAAHDTRDVIVNVASRFMTDPACYQRGAELGFAGADFYVAGRAGALGDVNADVVVAALVFFAPAVIHDAWERTRDVMPRAAAADAFATFAHEWARAHLPEGVDYPRLADLLGAVTSAAPVAGCPMFAAWRGVTEPQDAKALALHRMHLVRELRGGLHGAAVLTVGLTPFEAIAVRAPAMLPALGWTHDPPDPKPFVERWNLAEARTDRMLGRHLAALDEGERIELADLLGRLAPR
jgi:hypothetical protein